MEARGSENERDVTVQKVVPTNATGLICAMKCGPRVLVLDFEQTFGISWLSCSRYPGNYGSCGSECARS